MTDPTPEIPQATPEEQQRWAQATAHKRQILTHAREEIERLLASDEQIAGLHGLFLTFRHSDKETTVSAYGPPHVVAGLVAEGQAYAANAIRGHQLAVALQHPAAVHMLRAALFSGDQAPATVEAGGTIQ